jgi:beta-glucosidase
MPLNYYTPHKSINARDPASKPVLLDGAAEGHVLVKNTNKALPLKSPKLLSIFGYDAIAPQTMNVGGPGEFLPAYGFGFEGIFDYVPFISTGPSPETSLNGTLLMGGRNFPSLLSYLSDLTLNRWKWSQRTSIHVRTIRCHQGASLRRWHQPLLGLLFPKPSCRHGK